MFVKKAFNKLYLKLIFFSLIFLLGINDLAISDVLTEEELKYIEQQSKEPKDGDEYIKYEDNNFFVTRVSSQAIISLLFKIDKALRVISFKLPIGVETIYNCGGNKMLSIFNIKLNNRKYVCKKRL